MKLTWTGNETIASPLVINTSYATTVAFEFPNDGSFKHPFDMKPEEFHARPSMWVVVYSSAGGSLHYGENVLFEAGTPPNLPFDGKSMFEVVSLGGGISLVQKVVLDLR